MNQPKQILRLKQVIQITGLSKSFIYEEMKSGKFPRSIKLGSRSIGWHLSEINQWIDERIPSNSHEEL